jgi:hypothetical protein
MFVCVWFHFYLRCPHVLSFFYLFFTTTTFCLSKLGGILCDLMTMCHVRRFIIFIPPAVQLNARDLLDKVYDTLRRC